MIHDIHRGLVFAISSILFQKDPLSLMWDAGMESKLCDSFYDWNGKILAQCKVLIVFLDLMPKKKVFRKVCVYFFHLFSHSSLYYFVGLLKRH